jgi:hypothetical protein
MNMATTGTVQRDDAAECREKFEAEQRAKTGSLFLNREGDTYWYPHIIEATRRTMRKSVRFSPPSNVVTPTPYDRRGAV